MGQQDGIIKLKGQVGDLSFYKTKDGEYHARKKGGVSGERVKNDPAFARTRENMEEFKRAGKASKVLRTALRTLLVNTGDSRAINRLTREMIRVLQGDTVNVRGKRKVEKGALELLSGFEFNIASPFDTSFFAPYTTAIDRPAGTLQVEFTPFAPASMVSAPPGSTHFRLITAGMEIDFETGAYALATANSDMIELQPAEVALQPLRTNVTPASQLPLFLVLGIEFHQLVNGTMYPLKSGAYNALTLVKVDQAQP